MERARLERLLSRSYRLFGFAVVVTSFCAVVLIMFTASIDGLLVHEFEVSVRTNSYGEDWLEILLLLVSIPAVALVQARGRGRVKAILVTSTRHSPGGVPT